MRLALCMLLTVTLAPMTLAWPGAPLAADRPGSFSMQGPRPGKPPTQTPQRSTAPRATPQATPRGTPQATPRATPRATAPPPKAVFSSRPAPLSRTFNHVVKTPPPAGKAPPGARQDKPVLGHPGFLTPRFNAAAKARWQGKFTAPPGGR